MEKTFTYFIKQGEYSHNGEWDGDYGEKFKYTAKYEDVKKELKKLVIKEFGENAWKMVITCDLEDEMCEYYEEELKEAFRKEALESYC